MTKSTDKPIMRSKADRVVGLVFGVFFIVLAILILLFSSSSTFIGSVVAALVVGGLGGDSVVSAVRNQRSLISRIGPLP
jgi:uncharacterized membrane protein